MNLTIEPIVLAAAIPAVTLLGLAWLAGRHGATIRLRQHRDSTDLHVEPTGKDD